MFSLHRAVQQRRVLRHHADRGAERILRDAGDILPVDQDAPLLEAVEAQEQVDERRLAGARRADQPDLLARADEEREVADHVVALAVAERDVLEGDGAFASR